MFFPLSRVRLILKADLSQKMVLKKDYLEYLNHSLEYILKALVKQSMKQLKGRKKLQKKDLFESVQNNSCFRFLNALVSAQPHPQPVKAKEPQIN